MANLPGRVVPFPKRPSPIPDANFQPCNAQADAELRAAILRELFDDLISQVEQSADQLQIRLASLAAQDLLDELVVLYRRALSQAQTVGGAPHE